MKIVNNPQNKCSTIALLCGALLASACGGSSPLPTTSSSPETSLVPATSAAPTTTKPAVAQPPSIGDLIAADEPLNIAHAGGDQSYPHSTPFAFAMAVADGADVLEMDVQLSGDGVLIVQHDETLDRRTNVSGPVSERSAAELHELDGAYWFAPNSWPIRDLDPSAYIYRGVRTGDVEPPAGFTADDFAIVTFREIAERFPTMPFDIEMKGSFATTPDVAQVLADELHETDRLESTVVTSFDDDLIAAFSQAAPEVATSPGLTALTNWILAGVPLDPVHQIVQIPPEYQGQEVLTPAVLTLASEAGVDLWIWPSDWQTQENPDFYAELLTLGVAGVIVGKPAEFEKLLS